MTPLFQGQVDVNRSTKAKFAGVSFHKKFRHHRKIDSDDDFHSPCQNVSRCYRQQIRAGPLLPVGSDYSKKKLSRTLIKQNLLEYNFHFSSNPLQSLFVSCTLRQDLYLLYLTMLCCFRNVLDIWKTMAGESNLSLSIFDYILDLSLRSLPYQEKPNPKNKKETIRVATAQPTAVSYDTFLILSDRCTLLGSNYFLLLFVFFTVIVS